MERLLDKICLALMALGLLSSMPALGDVEASGDKNRGSSQVTTHQAPQTSQKSVALTDSERSAQRMTSSDNAPTYLNESLGGTGMTSADVSGKVQERSGGTNVVPKSRENRRYLEGLISSGDSELEAELVEISDALDRFKLESKDFAQDIQLLIQKKFDDRKKAIESDYDKKVSEIEVQERQARTEAIAVFEEFLRRYPNDPNFTPDALFRLAELYYEKTSDDEQEASRRFEAQTEAAQQGLAPFPSEPPKYSYLPSIALYQRLINDFPDYKHNDASLYLLGYCQSQQGEFSESRDAFNRLIQTYPKSRFVPEAWIRTGEYYFDATGEPDALRKAAVAYSKAVQFDTHPLYDKALYKLGWTYYRLDDFGHAVSSFVQLLDHYEKRANGSSDQGGDLKAEALQYIAISLAEDGWGSIARAEKLFEDIGNRPWKAELWRLIGNAYGDQTKGEEAIAAFRHSLQAAPLAPNAPQIHSKIVEIYERTLREPEKAFHEREVLTAAYAPKSDWYEANKHDSQTIKASEELAEKDLYNAGVHYHQQAGAYANDPTKVDKAKQTFALAAKIYVAYLERFPHSVEAYEITFYLADCLYNSLQFDRAVTAYERVRDFPGETSRKVDAALGVVMARQNAIDIAIQEHTSDVQQPKATVAADWPQGKQVEARPMHPLHDSYVKAIDTFVSLAPTNEIAPQAAYSAASIAYFYEDFPDARRRFAEIVANWPDSQYATFASNLTLETFLITEDWTAVIAFTDALTNKDKDNRVRVDPTSEMGKTLRGFGDSAMFKRAEQLMAADQWTEAGDVFEQLVARNSQYAHADLALNNAALCREKDNRFDSALKLFERLYQEYPKSSWAPKALFRVAVNAERSYDFDKAVKSYKLLDDKYQNADDQRKAAIHNMAILLEGLQRYESAASQFSKFAQIYPTDPFAAPDLYKAAAIYQKMGNCRRHIQAMEAFITRFGKVKGQDGFVVQAHKSIGDCWKKLGNEKRALAAYETTTKEYVNRQLDGTYPSASNAAGEASFILAEEKFRKWDAIEFKGSSKAIDKAFTQKLNSAPEVTNAYNKVLQFRSARWILAAFYRKAFIFDRFATSMAESDCPTDVYRFGGQDGCDEYRMMLVEKTTSQQTTAANLYEQTIAQCLRMGVIDVPWCDLAEESLARLQESAVLKKVRPAFTSSMAYSEGLLTFDGKEAPTHEDKTVVPSSQPDSWLADEDAHSSAAKTEEPASEDGEVSSNETSDLGNQDSSHKEQPLEAWAMDGDGQAESPKEPTDEVSSPPSASNADQAPSDSRGNKLDEEDF